ncbi:uncharacterized protein [Spinacia oleracea]|uniref:CCHC-type domain-containing protein n=1 Tax=Spinacia oleracea TaxID=3562 RepID=A0ABM3QZM4_SPIOL|nr:uncharacterized protein LOC130463637 [Spinacia oleracea]
MDVAALVAGVGDVLEIEPDLLGLDRIEFAYEQLPFICFACGILGHSERDCPRVLEADKRKNLSWRLFLIASPIKGRGCYIKYAKEVDSIASRREVLFVTKEKEGEVGNRPVARCIQFDGERATKNVETVNGGTRDVQIAVIKEVGVEQAGRDVDVQRNGEEKVLVILTLEGEGVGSKREKTGPDITPSGVQSAATSVPQFAVGVGSKKKIRGGKGWRRLNRQTGETRVSDKGELVGAEKGLEGVVDVGEKRDRQAPPSSMSILSLNCRGLGNPNEADDLRDLIRREVPSLVFLSETKLSGVEFGRVKRRLGDFEGLAVDSMGRSGGVALLWRKEIEVELRTMSVHHIDEVPFTGYQFTYDNGRESGDNIQCRIDKALVTDEWFACFPMARLIHLDREWSDNAPIKLMLCRRDGRMDLGDKLFRFEQIWSHDEECEGVIEGAWLGGVSSKIGMCAEYLKPWSDEKFGAVLRELKVKRRKLKKLNKGGISSSQLERRRALVNDIAGLVQHKEVYWKKRSRVLWLIEGDRNTNFFHQRAYGRKRRNTISSLKDDNDVVHSGDEACGKVAVAYFKQMFTTSSPPLVEHVLTDFQLRAVAEPGFHGWNYVMEKIVARLLDVEEYFVHLLEAREDFVEEGDFVEEDDLM